MYAQPPETSTARICFDERPCQLLEEVITPLPMQAGQPAREDYEYERQGTAVLLLAYDVDTGQRYVQVRKQRTKKDYAQFMEWLLREHYPHVGQVALVQDNLNTHRYGSFYEHLPAEQARAVAQKLNFHFTPKHGSWLNRAEIEFSVLVRQCLLRRIKSLEKLEEEVLAWCHYRNSLAIKIHWSFTVQMARQKLASQYVKVNKGNTVPNN